MFYAHSWCPSLSVSDISQAPCCAVFSKSCPFVSLAFLTTQKFNIARPVNHFCLDVAWVTQQVSLDQAWGRGGLIFTTSLGNTGLQTAPWEKGWFSSQMSPFSFFLCASHSAPAIQSFIYISFHPHFKSLSSSLLDRLACSVVISLCF